MRLGDFACRCSHRVDYEAPQLRAVRLEEVAGLAGRQSDSIGQRRHNRRDQS
jgi:hypothetical protein